MTRWYVEREAPDGTVTRSGSALFAEGLFYRRKAPAINYAKQVRLQGYRSRVVQQDTICGTDRVEVNTIWDSQKGELPCSNRSM